MSYAEARGRARRSAASRSSSRRTSPGASAAPGEARRRRRPACRRRAGPTRRSAAPSSVVRQAPTASKFSSAKPSGSITLWQRAHAGFARCSSIRSRSDCGLPSSPLVLERRHVGRRRRRRRAEQVVENPLAAHDRRRAVGMRGDQQDAALAEQALARFVGHRHAAELAAVDIRECRSAAPAARSRTCSRRSAGRGRCGPRG